MINSGQKERFLLMANFKHSLAAVTAIAIIGSLAASQSSEFTGSKNRSSMLVSASSAELVVNNDTENEDAEAKSDEIADLVAKANLPEGDYTYEQIMQLIEEKSEPEQSYVYLTSGTLPVYATPSEEAELQANLDAAAEVEILEATEDWYKISYNGDQSGYVQKSKITEDKALADFGAQYYDNYAKGKVVSNGSSSVRVRKGPTTNDEIITELAADTEVVLLYNDGDFVKICYNSDYDEGYMVASCLQLTGDFIPKTEVSSKKQAAAARRAAEAAEKEKEKAKAKAKASSGSSSSAPAAPKSAPSGSGSGQALVNEAAKYLGTPYVYGGARPGAFDCSGLVQYCCRQLGYSIDRTAAAQSRFGVSVSLENAQPGDLLFFKNSSGFIHHVGIYAGNGQMIHAPSTGDVVRYASINTAYRMRELCAIKRIF